MSSVLLPGNFRFLYFQLIYPNLDETHCRSELGVILYRDRKVYAFSAEILDVTEPASFFGHVDYKVGICVSKFWVTLNLKIYNLDGAGRHSQIWVPKIWVDDQVSRSQPTLSTVTFDSQTGLTLLCFSFSLIILALSQRLFSELRRN